MIEHLIATVSLAIATVVDIKKREVPDTISYGTMFLALVIACFYALTQQSFTPLTQAFLGAALCFALGGIMFYAGQWGGGDFKLIIGLGGLFGATGFLYMFLLFTIFAGAIYGIIYGIIIAVLRRKVFLKAFHERARAKNIRRIRVVFQLAVLTTLLVSFFVIHDLFWRIFLVMLSAGSYLVFYAWIFSRSLEECMIVKTPVSKLVEGDWIVGQVFAQKKVLKKSDKSNEDWAPAVYGVTREQILELKHAKVSFVMVKEGIPFVPSFTLAYIGALIATAFGITLFF